MVSTFRPVTPPPQKKSKVEVEALDMYFNMTSTSMRLMTGKVPYKGGREKESKSMQILIEALITLGLVVLDAYVSRSW
jgi:hypothetical protein